MSDESMVPVDKAASPISVKKPNDKVVEVTILDLISEWHQKNYDFYRNPRRHEQREEYRAKREGLGHRVRSYHRHDHEPQLPHEDRDAYAARLHRDRQRNRRGVSALDVRGWTDLSELTAEQKREHIRELAAERKRAQRATARDFPIGKGEGLNAVDQNLLDTALSDMA